MDSKKRLMIIFNRFYKSNIFSILSVAFIVNTLSFIINNGNSGNMHNI